MMQTLGFCSKTQGKKRHVQHQNSTKESILLSSLHILMSELSNDDDEGSENVAKKMNLRSFKLYRVYLDSLSLSNGGDVFWS